ncbi:hypothetical protein LCGC14_2471390, partial [marine sediment metagenome]
SLGQHSMAARAGGQQVLLGHAGALNGWTLCVDSVETSVTALRP